MRAVIHAGIYYANNSLKAKLCVEGKNLLYTYAAERDIPHKRLGKLIVAANESQATFLKATQSDAARNGVDDLTLLTQAECLELEPSVTCVAGLYSPSSGIIDSHALMASLQADTEQVRCRDEGVFNAACC